MIDELILTLMKGSVNRSLEKAIQEQLPRLESEGRRVPQPIISAAGGIQMEYESQMKRARREFQADRLKEEEQNMGQYYTKVAIY